MSGTQDSGLGNQDSAPVVNIIGERVALGPLNRTMAPFLLRWMNDFPTARLAGFPATLEPWTAERLDSFLDRALTDDRRAYFLIYETTAWRPIGFANLRDVDHQHGTAEFGITIGEPADRGKGFGTEATRLLMDYAFTALGVRNLWLDVFEFNAAGVRAYEKAGFKVIGRRREAHFAGGRLWDVIFMDCLAEEFTSPVLSRILAPQM